MREPAKHPSENDLALLAGGEAGRVRRFLLDRHVRHCEDCQDKVIEFEELRAELRKVEVPELNWNRLAAEMHANIRVGLEAGECVRPVPTLTRRLSGGGFRYVTPRFTMAFASLLLVAGASFILVESSFRARPWRPAILSEAATPVLEATGSGIEFRKGTDSFAFLDDRDHNGAPAGQSVSAQGAIEKRYVNGETGSVTITNVYLQQ
jgi:hypothetical protein